MRKSRVVRVSNRLKLQNYRKEMRKTRTLLQRISVNDIGHRLNGSNYLQWSQSALMFIRGRRKEKYLTGAEAKPSEADSRYETWLAENNMVMSWLVNSMTFEIGETYLLAETAKDIWDAVKETYSSLENTAALFQIKSHLRELKQGEMGVTQYYNSLVKYWQQIDVNETHKWNCGTDAALYRKIVERERIYDFLLGLQPAFEEVRGRIMGTRPLPTLEEVFNTVKWEESRKHLILGVPHTQPMSESSALVAKGGSTFDQRI